jgi:VWFA-related protein
MTRRLASLGVLALVLAPSLTGRAEAPFRGETRVNLVEIPVRVVDPATGEAVTGLRPSDFIILEDGAPRDVTNFAEVFRYRTEQDKAEHLDLVYFLDVYLTVGRDRDAAVQALRERYRDGVPTDERVSVVVFDGELSTLVERSTDGAAVRAALDQVAATSVSGSQQVLRFADGLGDGAIVTNRRVETNERKQRSREFIRLLADRVEKVGSALDATMARYAASEGRRVLVVFSPGQPSTDWNPSFSPTVYFQGALKDPVHELWSTVALRAADLGFTIFVIDPSGQRFVDDFGAGSDDRNLADGGRLRGAQVVRGENVLDVDVDRDRVGSTDQLAGWLERSRRDLLATATRVTGGLVLFDRDVVRAVQMVRTSLDHYYSLAYPVEHTDDGRTYDIQVRVPEHAGAEVQHRRAYQDQLASAAQAERLRSAMLFGANENPLGVRIKVGKVSKVRGFGHSDRVRVALDVQIPYVMLHLVDRGDMHWGKVLVSFFNRGEAETESKLWSTEQPIMLPDKRYRDALDNAGYFSYKATLEIERGSQQVYVGVHDLMGGKTTLLPQDFEF